MRFFDDWRKTLPVRYRTEVTRHRRHVWTTESVAYALVCAVGLAALAAGLLGWI